jgi:hypothetical protein
MPETERRSPYQGLVPFSEEDADFFFGRERETRLITANLFASPLTLLYGESGVGKSSVLRAGVVYQSRQRDDLLVIPFSAWQGEPVGGLKAAIAQAAARVRAESPLPKDSQPLADYLADCATRLDRRLMIILDQFEEYFLYHPQDDAFALQFPTALARADLPVSFLISIREDSLAKLDRFEGRIPALFDNYLRIEHLDREAARAAIEKPIGRYNLSPQADGHQVTIEPALVEAVLDQVKTGKVSLGEGAKGIGRVEGGVTPHEGSIETPFLQLVMMRLWDEEAKGGPSTLRLETLNRLGGAEHIVRTHLDEAMIALPPDEKRPRRLFSVIWSPRRAPRSHTARPTPPTSRGCRQTRLNRCWRSSRVGTCAFCGPCLLHPASQPPCATRFSTMCWPPQSWTGGPGT